MHASSKTFCVLQGDASVGAPMVIEMLSQSRHPHLRNKCPFSSTIYVQEAWGTYCDSPFLYSRETTAGPNNRVLPYSLTWSDGSVEAGQHSHQPERFQSRTGCTYPVSLQTLDYKTPGSIWETPGTCRGDTGSNNTYGGQEIKTCTFCLGQPSLHGYEHDRCLAAVSQLIQVMTWGLFVCSLISDQSLVRWLISPSQEG